MNKEQKREYMKAYNATPKARASQKQYYKTAKGKQVHRQGQKHYYQKYKGIYACFDTETSDCLYVGSSSAVNARINNHRYAINNLDKAAQHRPSQIELYRTLATHKSLFFEILDECDKSILGSLEKYYIKIYKPKYNKHNYDKL